MGPSCNFTNALGRARGLDRRSVVKLFAEGEEAKHPHQTWAGRNRGTLVADRAPPWKPRN